MPLTLTRSSSAPACRGWRPGIRLAHYDQQVCILERHTTIGGLNSFYRLGGRNYDVGLHAVTNFTPKGDRKGPLARLLRQLRLRLGRFRPGAAGRLARSPFPACRSISATTSSCWRRRSQQTVSRSETTISERLVAEISRLRRSRPGRQPAARPARRSAGDHQRPAAGRDAVLPADVLRRLRGSTTWTSGSSAIMFRSIFLEGLARPWPACG